MQDIDENMHLLRMLDVYIDTSKMGIMFVIMTSHRLQGMDLLDFSIDR